MSEPENSFISKDVRIKASPELWDKFEAWLNKQGCPTLPEGFRTAMRQVTQVNSNCQEKSGPEPTAGRA